MYTIKRYANGRFYDTEAKNYVTRAQILDFRKAGKKFVILDTKTGKDITQAIVSEAGVKGKRKVQQSAAKKGKAKVPPQGALLQLIRKGGDSLFDYGKKYASMWQNMVTMSKEEIDKVVGMLVKDKKISEIEADNLKKEVQRYRDNIEKWFSTTIDKQVKEMLTRMNLANRDEIVRLTSEINALNAKIKKMEKKNAPVKKKETSPEVVMPEAPVGEKPTV